jgi:hypothetical protein
LSTFLSLWFNTRVSNLSSNNPEFSFILVRDIHPYVLSNYWICYFYSIKIVSWMSHYSMNTELCSVAVKIKASFQQETIITFIILCM